MLKSLLWDFALFEKAPDEFPMKNENTLANQDIVDDAFRIVPVSYADYRSVYVLRMNLNGAGFGSMLLQTLNQIRYCERNGFLPVVNYDRYCNSYFFDKRYGNNMWAQYFEPLVPPYDFSTILHYCHDPEHPLTTSALHNLDDAEMLHICEHHEDSIYSFTFADWRDNPPADLESWYADQRVKGQKTFSSYIGVRCSIRDRADNFWNKHFTDHQVLGVHIRGTDLMYAPPVSPAEYFDFIDRWLEAQTRPKLFLATDQVQYLSTFCERYGDLVISYNCSRSSDETVPCNLKGVSPFKKGEDVLIDMLLLSKANFLIKGASNVGEFALYMNPELQCVDLSINKRFAFGQDYGKGWNGGIPEQTKPAWLLIKNTDLSTLSHQAKKQTRWQAIGYKFRPYYSLPVKFGRRIINVLRRLTVFKNRTEK